MPLPKRRHSSTRGKKRRTHWKIANPGLAVCPQCKTPKLTHRICPVCGFYAGKQSMEIKVKAEKKKEK
jgi:large subunit ribosomal protein L32